MGDRGIIYVEDTKTYLFTHWLGSELVNIVKKALKHTNTDLWSCPNILQDIIYADMIVANGNSQVGLQQTKTYIDTYLYIRICCKNGVISVLHNTKVIYCGLFNPFISDKIPKTRIQNHLINDYYTDSERFSWLKDSEGIPYEEDIPLTIDYKPHKRAKVVLLTPVFRTKRL